MQNLDIEFKKEQAILVGAHSGNKEKILDDSTEITLEELERLADTAGAEVLATTLQNRPFIHPTTYIGQGKVEELKETCLNLNANLLIFDDELSGSQIRNLEKIIGVKVIDRSMLILDIFAKRAKTKEGKIQVELAQLNYMLPRLTGIGSDLSRLAGGIGTRGPGESKLETDRRHIRRRIKFLEAELRKIKRHRKVLVNSRRKDNLPVAALIGYTNAGKSSLMNILSNSGVFVEDRLFATLDPTVRSVTLKDNQKILLIDTVGLIRKLPHHLIEAFKSTLEEIVDADVLLHVIDSNSPEIEHHIQVVNNILKELGAIDKPIINVYNKIDLNKNNILVNYYTELAYSNVEVSAITGQGISDLLREIEKVLSKRTQRVKLFIPYIEAKLKSEIHDYGQVISEKYQPEGIVMEAKVDDILYANIKNFIMQ